MSPRTSLILDLTVSLALAGGLGWLALTGCATAGGSEADRWLAEDKAMHAAGGAAIGALSYALAETLAPELSGWKKHALAIGASLVVGVAKEVADHQDPENHTSDWRDAAATVAGGALGSVSVSLVYHF